MILIFDRQLELTVLKNLLKIVMRDYVYALNQRVSRDDVSEKEYRNKNSVTVCITKFPTLRIPHSHKCVRCDAERLPPLQLACSQLMQNNYSKFT